MRDFKIPLQKIFDKDLCIGCGACVHICPKEIIKYRFDERYGKYTAAIHKDDKEKCIQCNKCSLVCPAINNLDYKYPDAEGIDSKEKSAEFLLGPYSELFKGYSKDIFLRKNGSSGGIATTLISHLLINNCVDYAMLIHPTKGDATKYEFLLFKDSNEIMQKTDSVYNQINCENMWNLLSKNADKKIAIVGLPCHLYAITKFLKLKNIDDKNIIKIGLFCGGISNHNSLKYLFKLQKVQMSNIIKMKYRNNIWPFRKMTVEMSGDLSEINGERIIFDTSSTNKHLYRFFYGGNFFLNGCNYCCDQAANYSDITLGDAWLPKEMKEDRLGTNILIVRTEKGTELINRVLKKEEIILDKITMDDVITSQGNSLVGRKLSLWSGDKEQISKSKLITEKINYYYPEYIPPNNQIQKRRNFQKLISKDSVFSFGLISVSICYLKIKAMFVELISDLIR